MSLETGKWYTFKNIPHIVTSVAYSTPPPQYENVGYTDTRGDVDNDTCAPFYAGPSLEDLPKVPIQDLRSGFFQLKGIEEDFINLGDMRLNISYQSEVREKDGIISCYVCIQKDDLCYIDECTDEFFSSL